MSPAGTRGETGDSGRLARLWPLLWLIWLPNIGVPVVTLLRAHPAPLRLALILSAVTLFIAIYLWIAFQSALSRSTYPVPPRYASGYRRWLPVAVLAGLGIALVLYDGPRWMSLLIFTSAAAGSRFRLAQAIAALAGLMLLAAVLGWLAHDSVSDVVSAAFWSGMAGVLVIMLNHLRLTNRALQIAHEENARLAVEAERLRIARDLHDLLGHNLAHIALASEMAGYLIRTEPERAAATIQEVGEVARTALREVRAAVAGYRQPTLAGELHAAAEILAAAGIAYRYEGTEAAFPPAVEAVLGWTVREGVTNVVKHSRAAHCTIRVTTADNCASVEVVDDGQGDQREAAAGASAGNGLAGLRERVATLGGQCEAGPLPGGGFRLAVSLPLTSSDAPEAGAYRHSVIAGRQA